MNLILIFKFFLVAFVGLTIGTITNSNAEDKGYIILSFLFFLTIGYLLNL